MFSNMVTLDTIWKEFKTDFHVGYCSVTHGHYLTPLLLTIKTGELLFSSLCFWSVSCIFPALWMMIWGIGSCQFVAWIDSSKNFFTKQTMENYFPPSACNATAQQDMLTIHCICRWGGLCEIKGVSSTYWTCKDKFQTSVYHFEKCTFNRTLSVTSFPFSQFQSFCICINVVSDEAHCVRQKLVGGNCFKLGPDFSKNFEKE